MIPSFDLSPWLLPGPRQARQSIDFLGFEFDFLGSPRRLCIPGLLHYIFYLHILESHPSYSSIISQILEQSL